MAGKSGHGLKIMGKASFAETPGGEGHKGRKVHKVKGGNSRKRSRK